MKALIYSTLLVAILFVASCSDDDSTTTPTPSTAASDYWMPSTVGARALFEQTEVYIANGVTVDSTVGTVQFTMQAGTKTTGDGKTASIVQILTTSGAVVDTAISYPVVSAASIVLYDESLLPADASTFLKAPLTVGNSWISQASIADDDSIQMTIASVTETVVTPAGTFKNCIRVQATYQHWTLQIPLTQNLYFSEGTGLVRMVLNASGTSDGIAYRYTQDVKLKSKSF